MIRGEGGGAGEREDLFLRAMGESLYFVEFGVVHVWTEASRWVVGRKVEGLVQNGKHVRHHPYLIVTQGDIRPRVVSFDRLHELRSFS